MTRALAFLASVVLLIAYVGTAVASFLFLAVAVGGIQ